jgi:hypothetical protein
MQNKIPEFFIERLKEYIDRRTAQLSGFYAGMRKAYFFRSCFLFLSGSWLLPSFRYRYREYLITSVPHLELIRPSERVNLVLVGGAIEFFYALRYQCGYINTVNLYFLITINCFTQIRLRALLNFFSTQFSRKLAKMKHLKFLLLDSDGLPYKRAICLLSQMAEKKVVCIQHGIFPDPVEGIDGSLCNLNLVIDPNQLRVFLDSGLSKDALKLLSDVSIETFNSLRMENIKPKIILVGEGWVSHDYRRHHLYMTSLKRLKSDLYAMGIDVRYRPHPSERCSFWTYYDIMPIEFSKRSKNIYPWNIYIGTMSSLLVEAVKIGAQSIQITDLFPLQENYEKYGVIQSAIKDVGNKIEDLNLPKIISNVVFTKKVKYLNLNAIVSAIP